MNFNSEHTFHCGSRMINYNLIRSKRVKTCEIIINDENNVMIRSPYGKPLSEIETLLKDKTKWITRKQSEYRDKANKIEIIKPIFRNNSAVPYLGKNLKLNIIQSYSVNRDTMKFKNNQMFAFIKTDNRGASIDGEIIENRVRLLYKNGYWRNLKMYSKRRF